MTLRNMFAVLSAVALCLNVNHALAGEPVAFDTPSVPPSDFKVKRAKAQGKVAKPTPGIRLTGVLSRPGGEGPYPAIIILSEGDGQQASNLKWSEFLTENGYVTLFVQSFASRETAGFGDSPSLNMVVDARSAYRFLSGMHYVDANRTGLFGFGRSGWFVQRTIDAALKDKTGATVFGAAAALYPHCDPGTLVTAPLLILAGSSDTRMSLTACRQMTDLNRRNGMNVMLHVYDGAMHSFDNTSYARDASIRPADWVEPSHFSQGRYDPAVHADAKARVLDFFQKSLR